MYQLTSSTEDDRVFYGMHGEAAERHGSIGYLRVNFGENGGEFWSAWVDTQRYLNTNAFVDELYEVIHSLRFDGLTPPLADRKSLETLCHSKPGQYLAGQGNGYSIQTKKFSYFFRCLPNTGNYDLYCFAYDNRWLLPELAGQHELPDVCYSIEPSMERIIILKRNEHGYYPCEYSTDDTEYNGELAIELNQRMGVTRGQEEAMIIGSMFGWNAPAAKPWKYDKDGIPLPLPPRKNEPER